MEVEGNHTTSYCITGWMVFTVVNWYSAIPRRQGAKYRDTWLVSTRVVVLVPTVELRPQFYAIFSSIEMWKLTFSVSYSIRSFFYNECLPSRTPCLCYYYVEVHLTGSFYRFMNSVNNPFLIVGTQIISLFFWWSEKRLNVVSHKKPLVFLKTHMNSIKTLCFYVHTIKPYGFYKLTCFSIKPPLWCSVVLFFSILGPNFFLIKKTIFGSKKPPIF